MESSYICTMKNGAESRGVADVAECLQLSCVECTDDHHLGCQTVVQESRVDTPPHTQYTHTTLHEEWITQ